MQLASLAILLSVTLAAPIPESAISTLAAADEASGTPSSSLRPLIYLDGDGSLWVGNDKKQRLEGVDASVAVNQIVSQSKAIQQSKQGLTRRAMDAVEPSIHFCCGRKGRKSGRYHRNGGCNECSAPCEAPEPCEPQPAPCAPEPEPIPCPCAPEPAPCETPCDPCDPCSECYDPCNPCCAQSDDSDCCVDSSAACLSNLCCPSCLCGLGDCCCLPDCSGDGCHPVVDALRSCCPSKWLCPSNFCPSNLCGCTPCCCEDQSDCEDPCAAPCDPCADPCAQTC